MSKVTLTWEVGDGYAGGSRPQHLTIDIDEMVEQCWTEDEARRYIDLEVQSDFENKITANARNEDDIVLAWREAREKKERIDE